MNKYGIQGFGRRKFGRNKHTDNEIANWDENDILDTFDDEPNDAMSCMAGGKI